MTMTHAMPSTAIRSDDETNLLPLAGDAGRLTRLRAIVAAGELDAPRLDALQSRCRDELRGLQDELQQLLGELRREAERLQRSRARRTGRRAA